MSRICSTLLLLLIAVVAADAAPRKKKDTKKSAKTTKVTKATQNAKPRTDGPWIVRPDGIPSPQGLDGRNIALCTVLTLCLMINCSGILQFILTGLRDILPLIHCLPLPI